MSPFATLGLAFTSIIERPLRSALTSLGIIIGVASVYAMLALGAGAKQKVEDSLNSIATRSLQVWPDWNRKRTSQSRPQMPFTQADVIEMRSIDGVYAATGNLQRSRMTIATSVNDLSGNFLGVDPDYLKSGGGEMIFGANISYADMEQGAPVAVISDGIQKRLFNGQNPIGQEIKVKNVAFIIKGVTGKPQSNISFGNDDLFVWVPLPVARDRIIGGNRFVRNHVSSIKVVGQKGADLDRIEQEMNIILRRSRDIKSNAPPDYRIFSSRGWRQKAAESTKSVSYLLAIMGIISLLVGGVGVMNIMLVSVTERTREIGLRMAIGARGSHVMAQFLTEALLLCVLSGIIGLGIGYGMFRFATKKMDMDLALSPEVPLIAFGSAVLIGLVFGFFPARRAASLNPIEALRHE
ncbi:MAG TPA: FtsX-like permease family protein [Hellea balneolensis]|uniref:FtsX-like permease family protein n=1 Tax=Hellea balneolensis TaxID=287478 RepID=A0A7C5QVP3_9PROT|nr:FtsX-like permease family protein [Hellea balneolensis]